MNHRVTRVALITVVLAATLTLLSDRLSQNALADTCPEGCGFGLREPLLESNTPQTIQPPLECPPESGTVCKTYAGYYDGDGEFLPTCATAPVVFTNCIGNITPVNNATLRTFNPKCIVEDGITICAPDITQEIDSEANQSTWTCDDCGAAIPDPDD